MVSLKSVFITVLLAACGTAIAQQQALVLTGEGFNRQELEQKGFKVNATVGNIASVRWTGDRMVELKNCKGIRYIETGIGNIPTQKQDSSSLRHTRAGELLNNYTTYGFPSAVDGKGVIIGIVDIGFQLDHPTFLDRTGSKNRIVRFWNQSNDSTGTPPQGYSYGALHTDVTKIIHEDTNDTHGTHVAGIAAGSGYGTPGFNQSGIAPGADIVLVQILFETDTVPKGARSDYLIANPAIIDAFDYIFKYADSVGKPAVLNLSWGMHTGPHDGTSLFDQAVDGLVGNGKVIVGAAGNDRGENMHLMHTFTGDTIATLIGENINRKQNFESIYTDFWGSAGSEFAMQVLLYDTLGNLKTTSGFVSSALDKDTVFFLTSGADVIALQLQCEASSPLNNKPNILFNAFNAIPANNYIHLRITSPDATLHAWNSGGIDRYSSGGFHDNLLGLTPLPNMKKGDNSYIVGENGGTSKSIITAGAYSMALTWLDAFGNWQSTFALPGQLASFSSAGPTVDGRIKPDIIAPGVRVSASTNRFAFDSATWLGDLTYVSTINGIKHYYSSLSGTSMAAPNVTGIVALMLQQNPALGWQQVRDILRSTAVADSITGPVPSTLYGWGKVDALAALQAVKGTTSVKENAVTLFTIYPNPAGKVLNIATGDYTGKNISYTLMDMRGKAVAGGKFTPVSTKYVETINIETLPQGIYLLQIETETGTHTSKFVRQ